MDAPSRTALAAAIARMMGGRSDGRPRASRRSAHRLGEVGVHAVRAGGNSGKHAMLLADGGEEVRLAHCASDRRGRSRNPGKAAAKYYAG